MNKPTRKPHQKVTLPAFQREVPYPEAQARLLQCLIDKREHGISSIELSNLGHVSATNLISRFKKDGLTIMSEPTTVVDKNGITHKGVATYKIVGCNVEFSKGVI
jgi:hypothetical protein